MAELTILKNLVNCDLSDNDKAVLLKMFSNIKFEGKVETTLDELKKEKNIRIEQSGTYKGYLLSFEYDIEINNEIFKLQFSNTSRSRSKLTINLLQNSWLLISKTFIKLKLDNSYYNSDPGNDTCEFKWEVCGYSINIFNKKDVNEKIISDAFDKYKEVLFVKHTSNDESIKKIQEGLNELK